jgi:hypothetical protein
MTRVFQIIFWIHQVLFGLPSLWLLFGLLIDAIDISGKVTGTFLFWIGGTLVWGFASLITKHG